jgi:hypothetical protein
MELLFRFPGVSLEDSLHAPATEVQAFGLETMRATKVSGSPVEGEIRATKSTRAYLIQPSSNCMPAAVVEALPPSSMPATGYAQ